jgi:hypothetical protein
MFEDSFRAGPSWAEELPETCRVTCQNKFVKLVHLVGFIKKKFVTIHGHMNVKFPCHVFSFLKKNIEDV